MIYCSYADFDDTFLKTA